MDEKYLYEKLEIVDEMDMLKDIPDFIKNGLSDHINLREYQEKAFKYFITYYETDNLRKNKQIHTLFHMATGSGKTVIMAGLILYLYTKGYKNFLFFVNQTNVIEKTKANFTDSLSSKYLFNDVINYLGNKININMVDNFAVSDSTNDINICFTTTQKLHSDLNLSRENSLTYKDFEENKVVFISDESHHINSYTKKATQEEDFEKASWEISVTNAFLSNKENVMLEFTATVDLKDRNVEQKYKDKIIFDYQLKKFRESGYTKDFQNFATESELWDRSLMAIVLSEYRKYLFNDNKINIKPVVLFKSQRIKDSQEFYEEFFDRLNKLNESELKKLYDTEIPILLKALDYFKSKDASFELLEHSLKNSFTKEKTVIMNETSDNNKDKQLLVNSLEDIDNPIRIIFTVDMLNEGWDVLNLFDIVRLYDTRQGSGTAGKVGSYTIKEAQLIGRGARYCPFSLCDEQEKYKRKYDSDLNNDYRILETMFFHSRNDSRYIAELKQALIQTGLQDKDPVKRDYVLKEKFKESEFYNKAFVFSNKRVLKDRKTIVDIEGSMKNKLYRYTVKTNRGNVLNLMDEEESTVLNTGTLIKNIKFNEIDYNILLGASQKFNELRFNVIKEKYPNLNSLKDFLTSDDYLGNSTLEITYSDKITGKDIYKACLKAFNEIANHIVSIKPEYEGTKSFEPIMLKNVIKNKSIYLSKIDENGGKGDSQTNCSNENYRLDLSNEDWYVFNDNYGTSEEKLFIKFFKTTIEPKLIEKKLEYYVVRNERIPELAIYSFDHGERFEPDFLLFVINNNPENSIIYQAYAEPKGSNLLEEDKWKEEFMKEMYDTANTDSMIDFGKKYKIIGLPFYNDTHKKSEFEEAINTWIEQL